MNENELSFEIDSRFFKEISNKYDEMLIYKSNYADFLLSQQEFEDEIVNPTQETQSKWLYLNKIKSFAKDRESFEIKGYATYTASGPDGEDYDAAFDIAETSLDSAIVEGKFQSKKKLILRFRKGLKVNVNINNMESVLLGGIENTVQDINTIDYSKTIVQLKNYKKLKDIIEKTSKSYNEEYSKHFVNMLLSLNNIKVHNSASQNVSTDFSQTIGFSIKSLSYEDVTNLELEQKNIVSIKITGSDLHELLSSVKYGRQWRRENLHKKFKDWIKKNTISGTKFSKYSLYLKSDLKPGNYVNGMVTVVKNKTNDVNGKFTLYYNKKTLKEELFNQDSYYTISYFSAFKSADTDGEAAYFKKSVQSNHVINVKGNDSSEFTATVDLGKSKTIYNFDIKTLGDKVQSHVKNLIYRIDAITDESQSSSVLAAKNKKINKKTSDISNFLRSFTIDNDNGNLKVLVKNITVIDKKTDYESFTDLLSEGKITSQNYHFFIPEVCLETLSGRVLLKKEIFSENDNVIDIEDDTNQIVLGKTYEIFYTISIDEIYRNLQTTGKNQLRSLTPFYNSKWFYEDKIPYKKETIERGQIKTIYPEFYYNINWTEGEIEATGNGTRNYVGKPQVVINSQLIGTAGGSSGIEKNIFDIESPSKQEELQGPKEKVLKMSEVGSNLEFKRLRNVFNNAKSEENTTEAGILDQVNVNKTFVDSIDIETNFFTLNKVDKNNPRGKDNTEGYNNVSYYPNRRNVYEFRRSNIQTKLISLISNAVDITKTKYPSLSRAVVLSMASPPASISSLVYILNKDKKSPEEISKELETLGFKGANLNEKDVKHIVEGFNKRGTDNNHANGLAADVYLKRKSEDGSEKYVCLYEPNDNKDFEIVNTFLTVCKGLGANGLGAGMYYMDEPGFLKHMTKKEVNDLKKDKLKKDKGLLIEKLYDELGIKYADGLGTEGKIIVDESGVPIRTSKINHRNAFHVDILSDTYKFFDNDLEITLKNLEKIFKNNENKLNKDAKNKYKQFLSDVRSYKAFKNENKKLPSKTRVWGENYKSQTADKWLKNIIRDTTLTNSAFNVDKISLEDFKKTSKDQFEVAHKPEKNKSGDIVSKYVSVNDIKK